MHLHGPQRNIQRNNSFPRLAAAIILGEWLLFECPCWKSSWRYFESIFASVFLGCCLYTFDNRLITCAGSEGQMPPFGDPDCTVVPLPSSGGSKTGSQENSTTVVFHPYPVDTKITLLSSWCMSSKVKLGKATPPQASFPLLTGALLTRTTHHSLGQNWSQRQKQPPAETVWGEVPFWNHCLFAVSKKSHRL